MDIKDYVNEANCQLNNKDHYKILNKDSKNRNYLKKKLQMA